MCLYAPAQYYKLNKGFFLGFLFKPLGGLRPPRGLNKKASEKHPLFITYYARDLDGKRKYICNVTIKISKTHILLYILELFTCHT